MQLKVSENIKRYRKSMDLTQEELAESLGVTIGAVSKWENGNNVPDITTLMELANLYNISMDELLGYDKSTKNVDALAERIENLTHEHKFDEATIEAKNALARYPHTFKILHICAVMYQYKYIEHQNNDPEACEEAISLYNRALSYISQNDDTDINEFTIKLQIAHLRSEKEPEKALEELKKINYNGVNDTVIAQILLFTGKYKESLDYSTRAVLRCFALQYTTINYMLMAVAADGKKESLKKALDIADHELRLLDEYKKDNSIGYIDKLKAIKLMLKAWVMAALGDDKEMEVLVKKAYLLASRYDKANKKNDLAEDFKFYYTEEKAYFYDSTGVDAVAGMDNLFEELKEYPSKKLVKFLPKVIECWRKESK